MAEEGLVIIYTTCADSDEARTLARAVVEANLAKCANIFAPHEAVFRWKGKVSESAEVGMILKASEDKYEEAVELLRTLHPYEVPVITWWGADAVPETLGWIKGLD